MDYPLAAAPRLGSNGSHRVWFNIAPLPWPCERRSLTFWLLEHFRGLAPVIKSIWSCCDVIVVRGYAWNLRDNRSSQPARHLPHSWVSNPPYNKIYFLLGIISYIKSLKLNFPLKLSDQYQECAYSVLAGEMWQRSETFTKLWIGELRTW